MTPLWMTTLPSHWKVEKLKYLAEVRLSNADKKTVEGQQPIRLCNYVDVYKNDFIVSTMPFMEASATDSQIRELVLRGGDVLITKDSEDWADIAVPAYVRADLPGVICGYHLAHLRSKPSKFCGGFLFRALAAQGIADQFRMAANGITRYGISKDDISSALLPVPPLHEQRTIAAFLDRKTAEINAVVIKKDRMIALLREERQALISRVVTRGIDAGVPMKDSGFRWLGIVPHHWRVQRLRFSLTSLEQGWSPLCDVKPADEDEWGVLKVGCVNRDPFDPSQQKALPLGVPPEIRYEIQPDDILVSRGNTRELVGGAALVPRGVRPRLLLCDLLYRLRVNSAHVEPAFMVHQLRSPHIRIQIESEATGTSSSMKKIGQETIADFIICLPDLSEQRTIVAHINRETSRIDGQIGKNEQQIAKLREYRQTLISAAVTGKLGIPDAGPPDNAAIVLAAEIVHRLHNTKHFGRTKAYKGLFAAKRHCELSQFECVDYRLAYGPYNEGFQLALEAELAARRWYEAVPNGKRWDYKPLERAGRHADEFRRIYGPKVDAIGAIIELLRDLDKNEIERAMTLYAAWNDFKIRNVNPSDNQLLSEVQTNWHPDKWHKEASWRESLAWLKAHDLIPHGFGRPTVPAEVAQ